MTLQADLDALGRMSKNLQDLASATKMEAETPGMTSPGLDSDMPSLTAARAMSNHSVPEIQRTIADRYTEVSDLVAQARSQFNKSEEDVRATILSAGNLLPSSAIRER